MRKLIAGTALAVALALTPTLAQAGPGSAGAGRQYGQHIAHHAQEHGGFSGDCNPGSHQGFASFDQHHDHEGC